jgi:hypothetical protein
LVAQLKAAEVVLDKARHDAVQCVLEDVADTQKQASAEQKIHQVKTHLVVMQNALLQLDAEAAATEEAERLAADLALRKKTAEDLRGRASRGLGTITNSPSKQMT